MRPAPISWRNPQVELAWRSAYEESGLCHHPFLGVEHVLIGLTRCEGGITERLLNSIPVSPSALRELLREVAGGPRHDLVHEETPLTPRLKQALDDAQRRRPQDVEGIGERELLEALLACDGGVFASLCKIREWSREDLLARVCADTDAEASSFKPMTMLVAHAVVMPVHPPRGAPAAAPVGMSGAMGALEKYGRDLTAEANAGQLREAFGRKDILAQIAQTLLRDTSSNPVLVGDAGVGKTAIVEGLAWRLAQKDRPMNPGFQFLSESRIIEISVGRLTAGTEFRGSFEARLQQIIAEAQADPHVILFIDELHLIVGAGRASGAQDAAQLLKPALARGDLRCIGATTAEEYDRFIAADPALARRFERLEVPEPSESAMLRILEEWRPGYEQRYKVKITDEALLDAIRLSVRYMPTLRLPDKALKVLDSARVRTAVGGELQFSLNADSVGLPSASSSAPGAAPVITRQAVIAAVSDMTGVPVVATAEMGSILLTLPDLLRQRIIGQESAIERLSSVMQSAFTELHDPTRPRAVLLFCGPTGVGKTELASVLAGLVCGPDRLRIFDMAELSEPHAVARLLGSPPGYVGYDEGGELTSWLQRYPQSVVIFDEIEKAHKLVHDQLLGLFGAGRVTDGRGRTVSGREAIFIMTSNLPLADGGMGFTTTNSLHELSAQSAQTPSKATERDRLAREELRRHLRAEFVSRIDEIIVFRPLDREALASIVKLRLDELGQRIAESRHAKVTFTEAVTNYVLEHRGTSQSGAREIASVVRRLIGEPLSRKLLELPATATPHTIEVEIDSVGALTLRAR